MLCMDKSISQSRVDLSTMRPSLIKKGIKHSVNCEVRYGFYWMYGLNVFLYLTVRQRWLCLLNNMGVLKILYFKYIDISMNFTVWCPFPLLFVVLCWWHIVLFRWIIIFYLICVWMILIREGMTLTMHVPISSKRQCVHLRSKAVDFKTSRVYSVM